jgi:hypothetical protein
MRTITKNIYTFGELSEEAKEKAIENLTYVNVELDWWNSIYYDAKEIGLKITSFNLDRNRHATGELLLSANEVAQNILNNHGETCDTYATARGFMEDWQPIFDEYMNEDSENYESSDLEGQLIDLEDDFRKLLLEDYSIMLQNEYEYLCSDEAIIETIEANEYEFDEYGNMI